MEDPKPFFKLFESAGRQVLVLLDDDEVRFYNTPDKGVCVTTLSWPEKDGQDKAEEAFAACDEATALRMVNEDFDFTQLPIAKKAGRMGTKACARRIKRFAKAYEPAPGRQIILVLSNHTGAGCSRTVRRTSSLRS